MTFEERIDRLTERHEALAMSVELMNGHIQSLFSAIDKLVEASNRDAENIRALARIAEAHERRITDIEDEKP